LNRCSVRIFRIGGSLCTPDFLHEYSRINVLAGNPPTIFFSRLVFLPCFIRAWISIPDAAPLSSPFHNPYFISAFLESRRGKDYDRFISESTIRILFRKLLTAPSYGQAAYMVMFMAAALGDFPLHQMVESVVPFIKTMKPMYFGSFAHSVTLRQMFTELSRSRSFSFFTSCCSCSLFLIFRESLVLP
jgi:hypothetical protein